MATAPTSPLTWTALPAADPLVGPDVAFVAASNGTIFTVPTAPGAMVATGTAITPNVAEIDWQVIASADGVMGPVLFGSIDTTVALYFYGGTLQIIEGA